MKKDDKNIKMEEYENNNETTMALDDEQRVKILSPGRLVFKRFIRNKLAITGSLFILIMFLFSFVGGWLMPYEEDQIFTEYVDMSKVFGGVSVNNEYKFITADGNEFPMVARAQFVLAANKEESVFESQDIDYSLNKLADELYVVYTNKEVAVAQTVVKDIVVTVTDTSLTDGFSSAFSDAIGRGDQIFEYNGKTYVSIQDKKTYKAFEQIPNAVATKNRYDYDSADIKTSFEFAYKSETTMLSMMENGLTEGSFTADGKDYTVLYDGEKAEIYTVENGETILYSNVSRYIVDSIYEDVFLDIGFKNYVKDLIAQGVVGIQEFTYPDENGEERLYTIEVGSNDWIIRWIEDTFVILDYDAPSKAHPVGTDGNGMDLLTRLMYGGRVSLIIGFIVVIIETAIGIVLGGIAGYFGKWVDNLIMRIVDTFNSIPSLPIIIILGFMMDQQRVDPLVRMMYLMVILAVLGWPGIARMVRGQILSLREQEFMIAAEATGISVSKRIFKHLIPNVMPQLIVISTLSLGGVILMESTLSFLGLGVKFPFASWGNIINAVSNAHVMTNYLFVWIPAGFCILITVLGFNFIGDGLRDAFDPRMKR
ncbi:MAG TPA: ABC transporter permease [Clostridia bacterium]|nr:ABC transporter permease [Clostridia bacterium]